MGISKGRVSSGFVSRRVERECGEAIRERQGCLVSLDAMNARVAA
jgi:hypothetical protein